MPQPSDTGYLPAQIALHWLIAALVLFQLAFGESMARATDAVENGTALGAGDAALATAHYRVGIAVLVLVIARLGIRIWSGVPPRAPGNRLMASAARATHRIFHILLVVVPVTGLIAFHVNPEAGDLHELAKPVFIVLIVMHGGAALFHQFVLRDKTLTRMLIPDKTGRSA